MKLFTPFVAGLLLLLNLSLPAQAARSAVEQVSALEQASDVVDPQIAWSCCP
jgi:hypothetical protein